jgi:hypothetical protein
MFHGQRQDALHDLVGRRLRVRLVDRWQVFQAVEAMRLKASLPLWDGPPLTPCEACDLARGGADVGQRVGD